MMKLKKILIMNRIDQREVLNHQRKNENRIQIHLLEVDHQFIDIFLIFYNLQGCNYISVIIIF